MHDDRRHQDTTTPPPKPITTPPPPYPIEVLRALDRLETLSVLELNIPGAAGHPGRPLPASPFPRRASRAAPRALRAPHDDTTPVPRD